MIPFLISWPMPTLTPINTHILKIKCSVSHMSKNCSICCSESHNYNNTQFLSWCNIVLSFNSLYEFILYANFILSTIYDWDCNLKSVCQSLSYHLLRVLHYLYSLEEAFSHLHMSRAYFIAVLYVCVCTYLCVHVCVQVHIHVLLEHRGVFLNPCSSYFLRQCLSLNLDLNNLVRQSGQHVPEHPCLYVPSTSITGTWCNASLATCVLGV